MRALFLTSSSHCTCSEGEEMTRILALLEKHDNSDQVKACLEASGYQVFATDTFVNAKSLLSIFNFELIISDVHLENGGNVFDFLRWVKNDKTTAEIPFVLLSSQPTPMAKYLADGVRISARMLGAIKYIEMGTFDADKFQAQIRDLLVIDKQKNKQTSKTTQETKLAKKDGEYYGRPNISNDGTPRGSETHQR